MLLLGPFLLLLITLYLLVVNKCSSETPESYHRVCVDVDVGAGVDVVVVNIVVVALLVVTDDIILSYGQ